MSFEIEAPEFVIETEIAGGATRQDVASTYALALRKGPGAGVDWTRINTAILARWSPAGLRWIKTRAWHYVHGRREFGT